MEEDGQWGYLYVVPRSESRSVCSRSTYIFSPRTRDVGWTSARGDCSRLAVPLLGVIKLEAPLVALRRNEATLDLASYREGRTE